MAVHANKEIKMVKVVKSILVLVIGLCLAPSVGHANTLLIDQTLGAPDIQFDGSFIVDDNNRMAPFLVSVFAEEGNCLRVENTIVAAGGDLRMTIISPTGAVWDEDDRSPTDPRPLIFADTTGKGTGWYTVKLSASADLAALPASTNFRLLYGLFAQCPLGQADPPKIP